MEVISSLVQITAPDVEIGGLGSATMIDASGGGLATTAVQATSAASHFYIHDLKILGPTVTSSCTQFNLQIGNSFASIDGARVERLRVRNGCQGIYVANNINLWIMDNQVITPEMSCILIDGNVGKKSSHIRIEKNYCKDPNKDSTTNAGIATVNVNNTLFLNDVLVDHNTVLFTGIGNRAGMKLDGVEQLKIVNNTIGGPNSTGEDLSFTSSDVLVANNTISDGSIGGILFFVTSWANHDVQIINNDVHGIGAYGIQIGYPAAPRDITAHNINVSLNHVYRNTGVGFQTFANGSAADQLNNSGFIDNLLSDNTGGAFSLDAAISTTNFCNSRNTNKR